MAWGLTYFDQFIITFNSLTLCLLGRDLDNKQNFWVYISPLKREEKMHLKMLSAEVVCCKKLPNITDKLSIEANSVEYDQSNLGPHYLP